MDDRGNGSLNGVNSTPQSPPSAVARLNAWMAGVGLALALVCGFFLCFTPISVFDLWWQMKTGEVIFRTGSIPHRDLFGWPHAQGEAAPVWVVHEWLANV